MKREINKENYDRFRKVYRKQMLITIKECPARYISCGFSDEDSADNLSTKLFKTIECGAVRTLNLYSSTMQRTLSELNIDQKPKALISFLYN